MSSEVRWQWHETYKRNYRDFAENGKRWRQFDNDSGPRVEIRPAAQPSSGQQQAVRRNLTTPRSQPATLSTPLQSSTFEAQLYDASQYPISNSPPNLSNQYSPPESSPLTDTIPPRDPYGYQTASLQLSPESTESSGFSPSTEQSSSTLLRSSPPPEGLDTAIYASGMQSQPRFQAPSRGYVSDTQFQLPQENSPRVTLQPSGYVSGGQIQTPFQPSSQVPLHPSGYGSGEQSQKPFQYPSQVPFQSVAHVSDPLQTRPYPEASIPQSKTRSKGGSIGTSRPPVKRNPSSDRPAKKYSDPSGNILTTASSRRRLSSTSSRSEQDVELIVGRMSLQQSASIEEQPFNELAFDEPTSEPSKRFPEPYPPTQNYQLADQQPLVSHSSYDWTNVSSNPKPTSDLVRQGANRPGNVSHNSQRMVEEQQPGLRSPNQPSMQSINEFEALLPRISSSPGEKEKLDQRYKKRQKPIEFFKEGRVFALLWSEPHGDNGTDVSGGYKTRFGQRVYSGIRRMVVVKERKGCSLCIPISTYQGQGTSKPGIDAASHAIIYMSNEAPGRLATETELTKDPIAVDPASPDQKLDQLSRVNFAKMYTVEHNVKVMSVGMVSSRSIVALKVYCKEEFDR